jgi:hypothetical protein
VRQRSGDAQDPGGIGGCRVGAQRVREAPVRALELVARQWLRERPVGVAVAAAARGDHDRRRRLEVREGGDGVLAVAVSPQHEGARDGVAAAVPAGARRATDVDVGASAQRDRACRQGAQPAGPVEDLAHALAVVEAVAQLEQLVACGVAGECAKEPGGGLVAGGGRGGHGGHREVVGPAGGTAPRARDGGQVAWWASRAAPSVAGLSGEASSLA